MPDIYLTTYNPQDGTTVKHGLNPLYFAEKLIENWRSAKIYFVFNEIYALEWSLDDEDQVGNRGALFHDNSTIKISEAPEHKLIDFILWIVTQFSNDRIYVFLEGNTKNIFVINKKTTKLEIKNFLYTAK